MASGWMKRGARTAGVAVLAAASGCGGNGDAARSGAGARLLATVAASDAATNAATKGAAAGGAGHGGADVYGIVNVVSAPVYRTEINARGEAAFEYVDIANRLRVGVFDGENTADITPPGADIGTLSGLNDRREVILQARFPGIPSPYEPFRWTPGTGLAALPFPNLGDINFTTDINERGDIVGVSGTTPGEGTLRALYWNPDDVLALPPAPAGFTEWGAGGINDHRTSVGSGLLGGAEHVLSWDAAGNPADLGTFGGASAFPGSINNRGEILALRDFSQPDFAAVLWSPGLGTVDIGPQTQGQALNNAGEVAGRLAVVVGASYRAFYFSRALGLVDLHRAPFTSSEAVDLNDAGVVVGNMELATPTEFVQRAYRWSRTGEAVDLNTRLLDPPAGLVLTQVGRISDNGDILANSNAGLVLLRRNGGTDAPVLGPIQLPPEIRPTQPAALSLSFRDRNPGDTHAATVDWGDGAGPQPATVSEQAGSGQVSASHAYAAAGDYGIVVRVADSSGRATTLYRRVSIFPYCVPGIAGEGSLPVGDGRMAQRTLAFRLAAPLVSVCGAARPFVFTLQGRVAFQGDKLERVSRTGNTVRLEGGGKLDGQPGYRFALEATDGNHGGATAPDRLVLRILRTDPATGRAQPILEYGTAPTKSQGQAPAAAREGSLPRSALRLVE